MNCRLKHPNRFFLPGIFLAVILISLYLGIVHPAARAEGEEPPPTPEIVSEYFSSEALSLEDGSEIERIKIHGPPTPPPDFTRSVISVSEVQQMAGTVLLPVPAFDWFYGCSASSAAMIAAYYDRNGYPNMYAGPTNGGVMPMNDLSWPIWEDDYGGGPYHQCPLTASHNGLDGRATRGSVDYYWAFYFSDLDDYPDPYITNEWTEHTYGDAIGDYMRTSQSTYGNTDGSTSFYEYYDRGNQLSCDTIVSYGWQDDGTVGRKLFYEVRGYTVTECYNQKTDNVFAGGFSFAQYKAEIDAGRPIFLNLTGHSIVGVGYNDATNTVYINDTWGYDLESMTWGGSYAGMSLEAVSMVTLASVSYPLTVSEAGTGGGTVTSTPVGINCGSDCTQTYTPDTVVKLTAIVTSGSTFAGWSGACTGMDYCWVTMSAAKSVKATFTLTPPGTYHLAVARKGTGSGTVTSTPAGIACGTDCSEFYTAGTVIKLTAVAFPGSTFTGWSGACGSMDYCWLTMSAARFATATFTLTPPGTTHLAVARKGAGSGTVTSTPVGISCGTDCSEFYTAETVVKLTTVASPGSTFTGWSGACGGTAYCWVTMSASRFVTANFALNTATLSPPVVMASPADLLEAKFPGWMWEVLRKWVPIL